MSKNIEDTWLLYINFSSTFLSSPMGIVLDHGPINLCMHFFFYQAQREKGLDNNNSILALKICILFIPIKELCMCVCVCVCDIEDTTHKQVE